MLFLAENLANNKPTCYIKGSDEPHVGRVGIRTYNVRQYFDYKEFVSPPASYAAAFPVRSGCFCKDTTMKKFFASILLLAASIHSVVAADGELVAPGLGDPGDLVKISIDTGRTVDGKVLLSGRDAGQQLIINGEYTTGQTRDLTRDVEYTISPDGVIALDESGYLSPLAKATQRFT